MVYLITDFENERCKIGCSSNPEQRLVNLQVANGSSLLLDMVLPGMEAEESEVHQLFKQFHIRGEWFMLDTSIMDYFQTHGNFLPFTKGDPEQHFPNLLRLMNTMTHGSTKVFGYLLLNGKAGVSMEIGKATRGLISTYCRLSLGTVANSLTELKEKKLISSQDRGVYYINPRYAIPPFVIRL